MWYARFGEESLSVEDQRHREHRKRMSYALRRALQDGRREAVLQQRAHAKQQRSAGIMEKKQACLDSLRRRVPVNSGGTSGISGPPGGGSSSSKEIPGGSSSIGTAKVPRFGAGFGAERETTSDRPSGFGFSGTGDYLSPRGAPTSGSPGKLYSGEGIFQSRGGSGTGNNRLTGNNFTTTGSPISFQNSFGHKNNQNTRNQNSRTESTHHGGLNFYHTAPLPSTYGGKKIADTPCTVRSSATPRGGLDHDVITKQSDVLALDRLLSSSSSSASCSGKAAEEKTTSKEALVLRDVAALQGFLGSSSGRGEIISSSGNYSGPSSTSQIFGPVSSCATSIPSPRNKTGTNTNSGTTSPSKGGAASNYSARADDVAMRRILSGGLGSELAGLGAGSL